MKKCATLLKIQLRKTHYDYNYLLVPHIKVLHPQFEALLIYNIL